MSCEKRCKSVKCVVNRHNSVKTDNEILGGFETLLEENNRVNMANGWYSETEPRPFADLLEHLKEEIVEVEEAYISGNGPSSKLQNILILEEELADVILIVMSMAGNHGLDVGRALLAKLRYNETRGHRHGR